MNAGKVLPMQAFPHFASRFVTHAQRLATNMAVGLSARPPACLPA